MRFFTLICLIFFAGCGYKPLSHYAKTTFGKSVYVEIKIPPDFPKAGVKLKDNLNQVILARLHLELDSKEKAESILQAEISHLDFEMIAQDTQGFANHYRANVTVVLSYKDLGQEEIRMSFEASSDYAASDNMTSLEIEAAQLKAINMALKNIADQFVSRIFYHGAIDQKRQPNNANKTSIRP